MALTTADIQNVLRTAKNYVPGTLWHWSANGNDANDGLTPSTPVLTRTRLLALLGGSGTIDGVQIAGVIDLGSANFTCPANLALMVGGPGATIKGQANDASVITVCSGLRMRGLKVVANGTLGVGNFQYPISDSTNTVTNVLIEDCETSGDTDGLYFTGAGSTVRVQRCRLTSNWDCCFAQNGAVVDIWDSILETTAQNSASPNANSTVQADDAIIRLYGCRLSNVAGNTNPSRITKMLHAIKASTGGRIEMHGGDVYMNVDGTANNLNADLGATLMAAGVAYDQSKTSGTIISIPTAFIRNITVSS